MANQISGRVIGLSPVKEVPSSDPTKGAIRKRELYIDCTRHDPYTGERSQYENKPLLEFGGDKVLAKLESLNLRNGDIVRVSFDIQGTPYTDKTTGKLKVYTGIRCYDVDVLRRAGDMAQAAPAPQPQDYHSNHQPTGGSPFPPVGNDAPKDDNGGLPF